MAQYKDALKELRDRIFRRTDWDSSPTESGVELVDNSLHDAMQQLVMDAPFLFFESRLRMYTQADAVPTLDTDTLSIALDPDAVQAENPFVFRVDLPFGTAGAVEWQYDRTWDGRWLEVTDELGVVRQVRIREVWLEGEEVPNRYYVAIYHPWDASAWGSGPFATWRVFTREYYLPDDIVEMRHMRVIGGLADPLEFIGQDEAERIGLDEHSVGSARSEPRRIYRRSYFQLEGPNVAPTVGLGTGIDAGSGSQIWKGPEPFGQFQYCITYTWGNRDLTWRNPGSLARFDTGSGGGNWSSLLQEYPDWTTLRRQEPMWESSPSPATEAITIEKEEAGSFARSVKLTLPDINYMLGFQLKGTRNGGVAFERRNVAHSGLYIRIYRRRLTEDYGNYSTLGAQPSGTTITSLHRLDIHDDYYLLAETRVDPFNEGFFYDDGTMIPDYERKLRNVHGYQAVRFDPMPDQRYELEARCIRRPQRLVSDHDAPPIQPAGIDVLVELALSMVRESLHQFSAAELARQRYREMLDKLKKRYGDLRPSNTPVTKRLARVGYTRLATPWRRS